MSTAFIGDDIEEWKKHFRISTAVGDVLSDLGVDCVGDLEVIYTDEDGDLLPQIRAVCANAVEFGRFKNARALTNPPLDASSVSRTTASVSHTAPSVSRITEPLPSTVSRIAPPTVFHKLGACKERNESLIRKEEELEAKLREEMDKSITLTSRAKDSSRLLAEINKRKDKIRSVHKQIKQATSVDLCFAVDCTGSMTPYLNNVCSQIISLSTEVKKLHPLISIRFAFVGYRDHGDGSDRISLFPFSTDLEAFQNHVRVQRASGGGGGLCEDVLGGLHVASNLEWLSQTRILFHVGDYPCHGAEFHNNVCDNYPSGDPNGISAHTVLEKFRANNVLFNFGRITQYTDKMISKFNELVGSPYISTEPITASSLMTTVTKSVSRSVTDSVSTSFRTSDASDKSRKREVDLDPSIPSFSSIRAEGAFNFELELPADLHALTSADDDSGIIKEGADMVSVKVAPRPFATGGSRAAFYAEQIIRASAKQVIVKESLYTSRSELTKAKYESFLACQRAAIFLAREFNKIKPRDCATVHFCNTSVLQLAERAGQPFMCLEDKLNGTFEKYNSNSGFCAPFPTKHGTNHEAVQAFSHWTHHFTDGYCMVIDCQGVYDRSTNTFTLTDPAIHCRNVMRFGNTNFGTVGRDDFFKGHVCNGVCAALRLPSK